MPVYPDRAGRLEGLRVKRGGARPAEDLAFAQALCIRHADAEVVCCNDVVRIHDDLVTHQCGDVFRPGLPLDPQFDGKDLRGLSGQQPAISAVIVHDDDCGSRISIQVIDLRLRRGDNLVVPIDGGTCYHTFRLNGEIVCHQGIGPDVCESDKVGSRLRNRSIEI